MRSTGAYRLDVSDVGRKLPLLARLAAGALVVGFVAHEFAPAAIAATCPIILRGPIGEPLGVSTAFPGDLNGDGAPDFAVGAVLNGAFFDVTPGRVYVYFGGPGIDDQPDLVLSGAANGDRFGSALAGAGDLNGDGFADLVVGANSNDAGGVDAGRVYVYFGGPSFDAIPDFILTGTTGSAFGYAVAGIGDFDADGGDDLLVGAPDYWNAPIASQNRGHTYLYRGGNILDNIPDLTTTGEPLARNGIAVAGNGDLDGDGHADLVVGETRNDDSGRVQVYWGGPGMDSNADLSFASSGAASRFGDALACADVNGDAYDDVVVGAPQLLGGHGRVRVYFGGIAVDRNADLTYEGFNSQLGSALVVGKDWNGDGYGDLFFGAPGANQVLVQFGGPNLDLVTDLVIQGSVHDHRFGASIAVTTHDKDGDGRPDLLIGAPDDYGAAGGTGLAYLGIPCLTVPVLLEEWTATPRTGGVFLAWRWAASYPPAATTVLLEGGDQADGPFTVRSVLPADAVQEYFDADVQPGRVQWYRLRVVSADGSMSIAGPFAVSTSAEDLERTEFDAPVVSADGHQVRLRYKIGTPAQQVRIDVYDVAGRSLRHFEIGPRVPGTYGLEWDTAGIAGAPVSKGVYFACLTAHGLRATRKFVLMPR